MREEELQENQRIEHDYSRCWRFESPDFVFLPDGTSLSAGVGIPPARELAKAMSLTSGDDPRLNSRGVFRVLQLMELYGAHLKYIRNNPELKHKFNEIRLFEILNLVFKMIMQLSPKQLVDPALAAAEKYQLEHPERKALVGKVGEELVKTIDIIDQDPRKKTGLDLPGHQMYQERIRCLRTYFQQFSNEAESDEQFLISVLYSLGQRAIELHDENAARMLMLDVADDRDPHIPRGVRAHDYWENPNFGNLIFPLKSIDPGIYFSASDGGDLHVNASIAMWRAIEQHFSKNLSNETVFPTPPNQTDGVYVILPYRDREGNDKRVNLVFFTDIAKIHPKLLEKATFLNNDQDMNTDAAIFFAFDPNGGFSPVMPIFDDNGIDFQMAVKDVVTPKTTITKEDIRKRVGY